MSGKENSRKSPVSLLKVSYLVVFLLILAAMRLISFLLVCFLLSACCGEDCDCNDQCKPPYAFSFLVGGSEYTADDIDTLMVKHRLEGHHNFDTSFFFLVNGKFQPAHPCAGNGQLLLDKNIPDANGKLARVHTYFIHTAVDSFRIDGMELTITKQGDKCCRCINTVERKFQVDSIAFLQRGIHPEVVELAKK